jgi:hypothetical protein
MTRDGKLLDSLNLYGPDSTIATAGKSALGDALFDAASRKFVEAASGEVTAVILEAINPLSAYSRIERPILMGNNNVSLKEFIVPPDITIPLLEKIDQITSEKKTLIDQLAESKCLASLQLNKTLHLNGTTKEITRAEKALEAAEDADLEAKVAQSNARENKFDQEWGAYKIARDAWNKTALAYEMALAKAPKTQTDLTKSLQTSYKVAQANTAIWAAHEPWIEARRTEQRLKNASISLADAEEAESDWSETIEAYNNALIKIEETSLEGSILDSTFRNLLHQTTTRRAAWVDKIAELKKIQYSVPIDPETQKRLALKQEERKKRRTEATRQAIEQYQEFYNRWSLPGEIFEIAPSNINEESKLEDILPPQEISDKELEHLGKELFTKERRAKIAALTNKTSDSKIDVPILTIAEREKQVRSEIMDASLRTSRENEARWAAREKADKLVAQAFKISSSKKESSQNIFQPVQEEEKREDKSIFFGFFPKNLSVIVSTIIETILSKEEQSKQSKADKNTMAFQQIMDAADAADEAWEKLVKQAEKTRIAQGGTEWNSLKAIRFWEEADKNAFRIRNEEQKKREKEKFAAAHQKEWQANTDRWQAKMIVDQCLKKEKEAKEEEEHLLQEKANIYARYGRRSEEAENIDRREEEARTAAITAQTAADEAHTRWLSIISNHHSVLKVKDQGEEHIQAAQEKLKASDEAVINLWDETARRHDESEFKEVEHLERPTVLFNKKDALLKNCFGDVDTELIKAQKTYNKLKNSEKKEATKPSYEKASVLEKEAQEKYSREIANEALKAARENGSEEEWRNYKDQSEQERVLQEKIKASAAPPIDAWANEHQPLLERATAVAGADRKAYEIFEKEKKRLSEISMIWEEIIKAKKRDAQIERDAAAQAHREGDENDWNNLTQEERYLRDRDIRVANETAKTEVLKAIEQATEAAKLARAQVRTTPIALFIRNANKAQETLVRLQQEETQRERTIECGKWARRSHEERKTELEERIARAHHQEEKTLSHEKALWKEVSSFWNKALEANMKGDFEHYLFLRKAAEQAEKVAQYEKEAAISLSMGDHENETLWQEISKQATLLVLRYAQAVSLDVESEEGEQQINTIDQEGRENSAYLEESVNYLKKALVSWERGELYQAELWRNVARQVMKLPEYEQNIVASIKPLEKSLVERSQIDDRLDVYANLESSECLKKSIKYYKQAAQEKDATMAALWEKAAQAADSFSKECYQTERATFKDTNEYHDRITSLLFSLKEVDQLSLIAQFTEQQQKEEKEGETLRAKEWQEGIKQLEEALELLKKREHIENKDAIRSWYDANRAKEEKAKLTIKIVEAGRANRPDI